MTPTPTRGVPVQMDRERRLRYTTAAIGEIEERFGVNILSGEPLKFGSIEDITWLAWLGLEHAGETLDVKPSWWQRLLARVGLWSPPELAPEHVAGWIDMQNMVAISTAIREAMGGAAAEALESADEPPGNPTPAAEKAVGAA